MNETAAPKKKTLKVVEDGAEQVEAATNVAVPFANFLPFIEEVSRLLKEIVDIYQTAVINKGICGVILRDDIDNKKIRADIEDLIENLQAIGGGGGRFDPNKNVSTIMDKSETNIFQSELLPYNDFEEVEVGEN
ncbi:13591_t:CDS:2 [Rhizophagus irregularis]|nr:13591_t:CDS:2 [Rhizophagus irregularis]